MVSLAKGKNRNYFWSILGYSGNYSPNGRKTIWESGLDRRNRPLVFLYLSLLAWEKRDQEVGNRTKQVGTTA